MHAGLSNSECYICSKHKLNTKCWAESCATAGGNLPLIAWSAADKLLSG